MWESVTTGSGAAYSKHLLESTSEPGARTARVLVDMGTGVQGAEDLLRVGRSRGDFPSKVPQMSHGPLFPSMRTDTQQHAETASMQVSSSVVVSQIMPGAYSASKSLSREDSLLGSIVNGLFAEWHLASMVCQWAKQDQAFCIGHLDGIDVAAKDKRAVSQRTPRPGHGHRERPLRARSNRSDGTVRLVAEHLCAHGLPTQTFSGKVR